MSRRFLPSVLVLAASMGCLGGFFWTIDYDFDVAAWRSDGRGEVKLPTSSRGRRVDLETVDELVAFSVAIRPGAIDLIVRNRAETPLGLNLGQGRFVDPDGAEWVLLFDGPNRVGEPATAVAPGAEVKLYLWPRDWMDFETSRADSPIDGRRIVRPERSEAEELALGHLGRSFEIVLPVESEGVRRAYRFRFTVDKIVPKLISWA